MLNFIKNIWNKYFSKKKVDEIAIRNKRPPAVKIELICDGCGQTFMAYPSEYPQLNFATDNEGVKPLIYCNGTRFQCNEKSYHQRTVPVNVTTPMDIERYNWDWLDNITEEELEKALREI